MAGPEGFRRSTGYVGSVPQNFINTNFPVCPLCGSMDPYWTMKDKIEMKGNRVQFRCKDCGGVLSATTMDFTGMTKSTAAAVLTTGGGLNYLIKKGEGKDAKTVYMRVDDAGSFRTTNELVGKEFPIDEMKRMAEELAAMAAPSAQKASDPGAVNPGPTPEFKVSYGENSSAGTASGTENDGFRVSYGSSETPAPAAAALSAPRPKSSVIAKVMTYLAAGAALIMFFAAFSRTGPWAQYFLNQLNIGKMNFALGRTLNILMLFVVIMGFALLCVGVSVGKIARMYGAGLLVIAVTKLIAAITNNNLRGVGRGYFRFLMSSGTQGVMSVMSIIFDFLVVILLILAAVYFLSGGKLRAVVKMIMSIIGLAGEVIFLVYVWTIYGKQHVPSRVYFTSILTGLPYILMWVSILLNKPFRRGNAV